MNVQKYKPPKHVSSKHEDFLKRVGIKLQNLRKQKKISIRTLSSEVKIARNSYTLMELGKVYFSTYNFLKLLDYYNLNAEDFFKSL